MNTPPWVLPDKAAPTVNWVRAWKACYAYYYHMATRPHPDRPASRTPGEAEKHWAENMVESSLGVQWCFFCGHQKHTEDTWGAIVNAGRRSVSADGLDPQKITVEIPSPLITKPPIDQDPFWDDFDATPWLESDSAPW